MAERLEPGGTVGILGGGQLGRMLSVAAARLGFRCHVFEPGPDPAAGHVAHRTTTADYGDEAALAAFARSVDVITFEFENIPSEAIDVLEEHRPVRPNRRALAVSQDRLREKRFLRGLGLATAPFAPVDAAADLDGAVRATGLPAVLKTRRFGYDGKGQVCLGSFDNPAAALALLNGVPAILEGFVDFSHEVSVIAARGLSGDISCFDPGENVHRDGILRTTEVPARLGSAERTEALLMAARILEELEYVGVLGVELFVTPSGLVVNEIAPRVHNSGHWTQNGCFVDQFEQHIRAIAGWPLGDGRRHSDVMMENLIGEDIDRLPLLLQETGAAIHIYGKESVRPGRKMGHVNRTPRNA